MPKRLPRPLTRQCALFLLAWQFLTRVPPPGTPRWTPGRMAAAPRYFPAVGALVGLSGAAVLGATALVLPPLVALLLSVAATLAMTGALHEDGLADTFDGLGAATPAAALEVMRDSRLGSFGALALGLGLALKVTALASLPVWAAALALVAGHAASRAAAVLALARGRYARTEGKSRFTAGGLDPMGLRIALACGALGLLPLAGLGLPAPLLAAAGLCLGYCAAWWIGARRLGGYTGDTLGATQQLSEIGLYLALAAWA